MSDDTNGSWRHFLGQQKVKQIDANGSPNDKQVEGKITGEKLEKQKSMLIQKEIRKREQLVQTYIVLFGLLLSYTQIAVVQKNAMGSFLPFMLLIMMYYSALTSYWYLSIIDLVFRIYARYSKNVNIKRQRNNFIKFLCHFGSENYTYTPEDFNTFIKELDPFCDPESLIRRFYIWSVNIFAVASSFCLSFVVVIYLSAINKNISINISPTVFIFDLLTLKFQDLLNIMTVLDLLTLFFLTLFISLPLLIRRDMLTK